jgi:hypothetical protein
MRELLLTAYRGGAGLSLRNVQMTGEFGVIHAETKMYYATEHDALVRAELPTTRDGKAIIKTARKPCYHCKRIAKDKLFAIGETHGGHFGGMVDPFQHAKIVDYIPNPPNQQLYPSDSASSPSRSNGSQSSASSLPHKLPVRERPTEERAPRREGSTRPSVDQQLKLKAKEPKQHRHYRSGGPS